MLARIEDGKIRNADERNVWDLSQFDFIEPSAKQKAPDTVNPSLWRVSKLLMNHGLYEVVKGKIYLVRGYDLSNMSIIRGEKGWILIDPLLSAETAAVALDALGCPNCGGRMRVLSAITDPTVAARILRCLALPSSF